MHVDRLRLSVCFTVLLVGQQLHNCRFYSTIQSNNIENILFYSHLGHTCKQIWY